MILHNKMVNSEVPVASGGQVTSIDENSIKPGFTRQDFDDNISGLVTKIKDLQAEAPSGKGRPKTAKWSDICTISETLLALCGMTRKLGDELGELRR